MTRREAENTVHGMARLAQDYGYHIAGGVTLADATCDALRADRLPAGIGLALMDCWRVLGGDYRVIL